MALQGHNHQTPYSGKRLVDKQTRKGNFKRQRNPRILKDIKNLLMNCNMWSLFRSSRIF